MPSPANTPRRILRARLQRIAVEQATIDAELLNIRLSDDPFAALRIKSLSSRADELDSSAIDVRSRLVQLPVESLRPEEINAVEFLRAVGWHNSAVEVERLLIDPLTAIIAVARFHLEPKHQDQYHELLARLVAA